MTNPTSNFGWQMPTSTDLVTDLPADFEVFGQAVDTSLADLKGGTTGQVLKKNTNADMDFVWSADAAGMTNPMTTTGDTIYSSSGSTPARLGIGSTGNVLTVSGGLPVWSAPAAAALGYELIGSTTSTSVSTVTFNFSGYHNLLLSAITSASAGSMANRVQLNGVTTNTYRNGTAAFNSTPAATTQDRNALSDSMDIQPNTATTGDVVTTAFFTGCNKAAFPVCTFNTIATFSTTRILNYGMSVSENNTAVTSLTFFNLNGTNFGTGTSIYLYGAK